MISSPEAVYKRRRAERIRAVRKSRETRRDDDRGVRIGSDRIGSGRAYCPGEFLRSNFIGSSLYRRNGKERRAEGSEGSRGGREYEITSGERVPRLFPDFRRWHFSSGSRSERNILGVPKVASSLGRDFRSPRTPSHVDSVIFRLFERFLFCQSVARESRILRQALPLVFRKFTKRKVTRVRVCVRCCFAEGIRYR